jgi:TetR/AcrR family transcriptional regulator, cholesterol catabolism regulator
MEEGRKSSSKRISAISKAGAELFATKGFVETSMHDVATAAKLSKGGIYHYFSSKTELLDFIINSFIDVVLEGLEEDLAKETNDMDRLKALIYRHVRLYPQNMYKAKVLISEAHNLPRKSRKKILVKEKEYYRVITEVLTGCLGSSVEKDRLTTITFSLLGMCNWIYRWYNPKGPISWEELSQTIFDIFMNGISGLKANSEAKL